MKFIAYRNHGAALTYILCKYRNKMILLSIAGIFRTDNTKQTHRKIPIFLSTINNNSQSIQFKLHIFFVYFDRYSESVHLTAGTREECQLNSKWRMLNEWVAAPDPTESSSRYRFKNSTQHFTRNIWDRLSDLFCFVYVFFYFVHVVSSVADSTQHSILYYYTKQMYLYRLTLPIIKQLLCVLTLDMINDVWLCGWCLDGSGSGTAIRMWEMDDDGNIHYDLYVWDDVLNC